MRNRKKAYISTYAYIFKQDVCSSLSSEFTPLNCYDDFYTIVASDNRLKRLLTYNSYDYLRYDFDKLLSAIISNLIVSRKTYIQFNIMKNDKDAVIGVSIEALNGKKLVTVGGNTIFLSKGYNGKFKISKVPVELYVELNVNEIVAKQKYFKKTFLKLNDLDKLLNTSLMVNEKNNSSFEFDIYKKRHEFLMLKYTSEFGGGRCDLNNSLLSESYRLYRYICFKSFRKKTLEYLLMGINKGLKSISNIIDAEGKIVVEQFLIDYEKEWNRYINGEVCTSEFVDIVYR